MSSIIEIIKRRISIRSYTDQVIAEEIKNKIRAAFQENCHGPFGNKIRFQLVEVTDNIKQELKELGTYGFIRGAHLFIAGAVKRDEHAFEDFGYCMEKNILTATDFGLGTCWLGGALNRSTFAQRIKTTPDEVIPAVTPLGYPAAKMGLVDNITRAFVGSKHRKEFGEIFFSNDCNTSLDKSFCGKYDVVLENVRLAPSASNKQPWRIIKEKGLNTFHFYLKENSLYNNMIKDIKIQNLDMGIAICHFELVVKELDLKGVWQVNDPQLNAGNWHYIISWVG